MGWAPGRNKEDCDISSETPIGNSAAVTTPLIEEEPRIRYASRRFFEQLARVARVTLATDHEGRSSFSPIRSEASKASSASTVAIMSEGSQ